VPRYPPYTKWHIFTVRLLLERLPSVPPRPMLKLAMLVMLLILWRLLGPMAAPLLLRWFGRAAESFK